MAKRELPKHVYRQRNGIYFQRRGWPSQKFSSPFGTPEFWKEYSDILSGEHPPKRVISRNFTALIAHYRKSPRYKRLKPRTALDYDKYLDFFQSIMGEVSPLGMKRKDVIRLRDANAEKAYFANYSLRVLRVLMEHCVDLGWRETNPAKGVPELKTEKSEREPWPLGLLDAYRTACALGTRERLVMELCVGTGQRIGDVLEMRWSDIQDGAFVIKQNKTGKELWVPILPELRTALSSASRHSLFILTNERGTNRWSYRGASQAVRNVRERIGALDYDIHSWRYNAACELVEAGCSDDLVAAVTGQSPAMVLHYTKKVRQRIRAIEAQQKRTEQKQNV
ncbi:tyrosine-type recombinase/integrase [Sulfitobacter pseudonitzschiae]|uniref:Tyrosine-type recombinase/integrase n=1 Tax=Pseudosulfitobacter pseudonitzschiae TaxID=1402135 RepID=A0A9Q2NK51_9RHOB|nr:tyrosine-type recombinase/integrase [Pseudosulfitobacter pseudonitzschiae]MBM2291433.1 tyrosine-type recombinase/integrase [Pseudosulfitobacter pseudonitzschiae]MBM2296351.1 tyrosine-type recombinase/integrase [Pseudosulfitobacter pseudonitzschiae]MBM2301264.1 tyrosine-type recombinase/integrase [Pseudosulfitobacter pseudonitzschiae]MBM2311048.1 tyrosine-type recombinase/integrase [Pseudosulfitobacter pseudonitzschiae]MBM2315961.1 tyrosine-type recombinase/integrase [Pseudosulfitobacter pse